ncbi:MAG TPA: hypothetical protein VL860_15305, partial [Planctomycetota bacterium]|nr:hypothetical protein [Planctomycetota bacterium]
MTDSVSTPMSVMQLQYCPICRHLMRPSMLNTAEAVVKEGVYYHATCLAKGGERISGRSAAQDVDFDNEDGAQTDFQNYDKVVVESITAIRNRKSPGTSGTGQHGAVRRKTTTSAAAGAGRIEEPAPAARRSSMILRSYSEPRKQSSGALVGVIIGALVLIGIGAFFLMNSGGTPSAPVTANNDSPGTTSPVTRPAPSVTGPGGATATQPGSQAPAQTGTQPGANSTRPAGDLLPPAPATGGVDTSPTPYDLAHRNQPADSTVAQPGAAETLYEAAGPAVTWSDATTMGEWKIRKSEPNAFAVKDGVIELDPKGSPGVIEHPLPLPDFDLTFDLKMGEGNSGIYGEFWILNGVVKFTGADFQSPEWTPVQLQVRGGKISATHGTKGPTGIHPAFVDMTSVSADRAAYFEGRSVVMFFFGSAGTKSLRNIQYSPMRPVAKPVAQAPVPVAIPASAAGANPLPLPTVIAADKKDQPLGSWRRMTEQTEDGKAFMRWDFKTNAKQTLFFEPADQHRTTPPQLHVRMEYRTRNYAKQQLTLRFWFFGNATVEQTVAPGATNTWQTAEFDLSGCKG